MAIYSLFVKPVSRLQGNSVVKIAAYQSRRKMYDERMDLIYDFTHKTDLMYQNVFLPTNAPIAFRESSILWNAAEQAENRYDGRTGRTLWCALPNELNLYENIEIVKNYVETFLSIGMCADVAIHLGLNLKNSEKSNPHLHLLLTDRPVDYNGFCPKKNREWNKRELIKIWRKELEVAINRAYERNKLPQRVSCESLEVQGEKREPTKRLSRSAIEMEQRGILTEQGNVNREIEVRNKKKKQEKHEEHIRKRLREFER